MTQPLIVFQILTLLVGLATATMATLAFVRAGRWRDSDDGKAVKEDIHSIKNELAKIQGRLAVTERVEAGLPAMTERAKKKKLPSTNPSLSAPTAMSR